MTRALLTKPMRELLEGNGFYVVPDAGGKTATLFKVAGPIAEGTPVHNVGILSYSNQSVDYDLLMQLIHAAA